MNVSVISAIISAVVAILIAVANHFIIEPWKEKKRWKKQQLANFYAPLYGLVDRFRKTVHRIIRHA